ncbi:hypothetical protein ABIB40_001103 [Pedobacter sp. UYP30]
MILKFGYLADSGAEFVSASYYWLIKLIYGNVSKLQHR